jgi:hypothetical protein
MDEVRTEMKFTREHVAEILAANQFGDLVGVRALVVEEVDSRGKDVRYHSGWFVAGTLGYVELNTDGGAYLAGAWRPAETYGM